MIIIVVIIIIIIIIYLFCKSRSSLLAYILVTEEIAFSMSKIHFNVNDEGIILQSNKNAKIIIQYK